jgi:hypothetical protein
MIEAIRKRFGTFATSAPAETVAELTIVPVTGRVSAVDDICVTAIEEKWRFEREEFCAEWDPRTGRGWVREGSGMPHSIDTILRLLHSILLAPRGGFLIHAASAIRNGEAFVFSGVSGAGKTTMIRQAPSDSTILTDEISYIKPVEGGYRAFGTPFAGDFGEPGKNVSAPLKALYLLAQGPENKIEPVPHRTAVASLLRNTLFFAKDPELVRNVFETACSFVDAVPVYRLTFVPTPAVWEIIG